jgi:hypothetical protein
MRMHRSIVAAVLGVCVAGCGGAKEPVQSPAEAGGGVPASEAASGKSDGGGAESGAAEPGPAAKVEAKPAPSDDGPKPSRTALDILTAPDVLFLFSFNDSAPKQAAEEACTKKAGDNPKKMNECMAAARQKFPPDGYRFKKDEREQWWWITVRQNGNRLTTRHKIPVEFAEETPTSVTLKPMGKDQGSSPMTPPAKVVFEVPNDYQIALDDPKAGRLVFQAKVGVVSE